jgi:DNA-binding GntR family transcriptional regulator
VSGTIGPLLFRTKTQMALELLRQAILGGEIEANAPLKQVELARRLGISLTPLREAMHQLTAEGLIVHEAHKGMHVAGFSSERMKEIDLIRAQLEALAVLHAAPRMDGPTLDRLVAIHEQLEAAVKRGDREELRPLNYEFHMTIYKASGLSILMQEIVRMWAMTPRDSLMVVSDRPQMTLREHQRVLDALLARDGPLAARRLQEHIGNACESIVSFIEARGGDSPAPGRGAHS